MRNPRGASPELLARTRRVVLKCGRSHDARPPARAGAQRNSARARSAPRVQLFHHPIACAVAWSPIGAGAGGVCVDAASAIAPHLPAQPRGSASTGSGPPSCGSSSPLRLRTTGARCLSRHMRPPQDRRAGWWGAATGLSYYWATLTLNTLIFGRNLDLHKLQFVLQQHPAKSETYFGHLL